MAAFDRLQRLSDAEVVEMARLGSMEAYDELVRRFRGAVLLVAGQYLSSRPAAEDVAQETFLLAFKGLAQLREAAKFPAWLYAIARQRARRVGMREGRVTATEDAHLEDLAVVEQGVVSGPLKSLLDAERQEAIRAILADLPQEVQIVLRLFYYEQWTAARIAEFLSLPLTTIKWRLHSGKSRISPRIAEILERECYVRRREERDPPAVQSGREDGESRRACGADGELREWDAELGDPVQCDPGAPQVD